MIQVRRLKFDAWNKELLPGDGRRIYLEVASNHLAGTSRQTKKFNINNINLKPDY